MLLNFFSFFLLSPFTSSSRSLLSPVLFSFLQCFPFISLLILFICPFLSLRSFCLIIVPFPHLHTSFFSLFHVFFCSYYFYNFHIIIVCSSCSMFAFPKFLFSPAITRLFPPSSQSLIICVFLFLFSFYFPFSFLFISPLPSTILPSFFLLLFHPFSPSFLFSFSSVIPSSFPSSSAAVMFLTPSRTFSHLVSALAAYLTI